MITHLEPDILECEVKRALESIAMNKASRGDGIPVELFQILKDDAVKVLYSICQQILKTQQWPQGWKKSIFIPNPKKGNAKECLGFPCGSDGKESTCSTGNLGSIPGLGISPGEGHGNLFQNSCLENPHAQRSLVGYSPWGPKDSDKSQGLSTAQHSKAWYIPCSALVFFI